MGSKSNTLRAGSIVGEVAVTPTNSDDAGDDAFSQVIVGSGGSVTYRADTDFSSGWCAEIVQPTAATIPTGMELVDAGSSADGAWAWEFKPPASAPSGDTAILQLRSATDAQQLTVQLSAGYLIRVKTSAGAVFTGMTGAVALSAGSVYRLELQVSGSGAGAGAAAVAFQSYPSPTSTSALESLSSTSQTIAGALQRVRNGRLSAATFAAHRQSLVRQNIGSSAPLGPVSQSVNITPNVVALPFTVPPMSGTTTSTATPDPVLVPFSVPAPTVTATKTATAVPAAVAVPFIVPAPAVTNSTNATAVPAVVAMPFVVPAPTVQATGAVVGGTLAEQMVAWFKVRAAGSTLADLEFAYFSGVSGLPAPAAAHPLSAHKHSYYRQQLGLTLAQTAAMSITDLEFAYWQSVTPSNNAGSRATRARRFYGGS